MEFMMCITCPNCGDSIFRYMKTFNSNENDMPIVDINFFADEDWTCDNCGCYIITIDEQSMYTIEEDGDPLKEC